MSTKNPDVGVGLTIDRGLSPDSFKLVISGCVVLGAFTAAFLSAYTITVLAPISTKDHCQSNPCLNNGTCVKGNPSMPFTCSCIEGYSGATCENGLIDVQLSLQLPFLESYTNLSDPSTIALVNLICNALSATVGNGTNQTCTPISLSPGSVVATIRFELKLTSPRDELSNQIGNKIQEDSYSKNSSLRQNIGAPVRLLTTCSGSSCKAGALSVQIYDVVRNNAVSSANVISIQQGDQLNCTTSSTATTTIEWYLNGELVGRANNSLVYTANVTGNHSLMCNATVFGNGLYNSKQRTVALTVVDLIRCNSSNQWSPTQQQLMAILNGLSTLAQQLLSASNSSAAVTQQLQQLLSALTDLSNLTQQLISNNSTISPLQLQQLLSTLNGLSTLTQQLLATYTGSTIPPQQLQQLTSALTGLATLLQQLNASFNSSATPIQQLQQLTSALTSLSALAQQLISSFANSTTTSQQLQQFTSALTDLSNLVQQLITAFSNSNSTSTSQQIQLLTSVVNGLMAITQQLISAFANSANSTTTNQQLTAVLNGLSALAQQLNSASANSTNPIPQIVSALTTLSNLLQLLIPAFSNPATPPKELVEALNTLIASIKPIVDVLTSTTDPITLFVSTVTALSTLLAQLTLALANPLNLVLLALLPQQLQTAFNNNPLFLIDLLKDILKAFVP